MQFNKRGSLLGLSVWLVASMSQSSLAQEPTRYEVEDACLVGDLLVESDPTASNGNYVNMTSSGTISWEVGVPEAGEYELTIGFRLPFGVKNQFLLVNGVNMGELVFDGEVDTWLEMKVSANLDGGTNTIALDYSWGFMHFDYLEVPDGEPASEMAPNFVDAPAADSIPSGTVTYARDLSVCGNPKPTLEVIEPEGATISEEGALLYTLPDPEPDSFEVVVSATNSVDTVEAIWTVTVNPVTGFRYEAEDAFLVGEVTVEFDADASNQAYAYMRGTERITWDVAVPEAGEYMMTIGYYLPFGDKTQYLLVNDIQVDTVVFDGPIEVWQSKTVSVFLNPGANTVSLGAFWGWMYFDYIEIPEGEPAAEFAPEFVDPPLEDEIVSGNPIYVRSLVVRGNPKPTLEVLDPDGATISEMGLLEYPIPDPEPTSFEVVVAATNSVDTVEVAWTVTVRGGFVRFEAEDALLQGNITVLDDFEASNGLYVNMTDSESITWTIEEVPDPGPAQLAIGYRLPFDVKHQFLNVNGMDMGEVAFDGPVSIWQEKTVDIELQEGTNTIVISASWGYMHFDYIALPFGEPSEKHTFRRGDGDGDGVLSIGDPIANLSFQFLGTVEAFCKDAFDFDDSGMIDVSDPVGNLGHQFLGSAPPPPPGIAACGVDPTPDKDGVDLGCEAYPQDRC